MSEAASEPTTDAAPQRGRRYWGTRIAALVAGVLVALIALWYVVLLAGGGHVFVVETPSMARTAPVGSLVVTEPVQTSTLHVGDVISFRPPGMNQVYTHRIVDVTSAGFRTKGDLNQAADGWVIPGDRVVGKAVHLWFGVGWLLKMLPWLAFGGIVTMLVRWRVQERHRAAVGIAGSALSLSLALIIVRPLVRAQTMGFVVTGDGGVRMSAIGTGLLPIRATSLDKHSVDLAPGQLGWVETHQTDAHGRFELVPALHLPWWGWVLLVLFCLSPLLAALAIREDPCDAGPDDDASATGTGQAARGAGALAALGLRGKGGVATFVAAVVSSGVLAAALQPTGAALTAAIQNSTDTVASRPAFTCLDAMQYFNATTHNGRLYTGFAMGNGTGVTGTTDQGKIGPYNATAVSTVQTTNVGCISDANKRAQAAVTFNGTSSQWNLGTASSISNVTANPGNANQMTWNTWIRTTSTKGGVISCPGGTNSVCADRVTWLNNAGQLVFGVGTTMIVSPKSYNDGAWHMVTTQIDSSSGMTMWVDGVQVAQNGSITGGDGIISYPQWGYSAGALKSAFSAQAPTSLYYAGDMQMAAIYGAASNGKQVGQAEVTMLYQAAQP